MKISMLVPCLFLTLLLPACAGKVDATPPAGVSVSDAYTAAAATLIKEANVLTPTAPASPTTMPTLWFSATPITSTPTAQPILSSSTPYYGCYSAAYVSDVTIPDGTYLAPGESFTKTWQFMNTGTCQWEADFLLTFETGTDMDGTDTLIGESVAAGETASLSVPLVAPETAGSYTSYWRLTTDSGEAFGSSVFVLIVVSEDAATATPTTTSTSTAYVDDTPTYTPSCTAIPTTTPSQVEEITETASNTPTSTEDDDS